MMDKKYRVCRHCHKKFIPKQNNQRYCEKCKTPKVKCANCGKEFILNLNQRREYYKSNETMLCFCSKRCAIASADKIFKKASETYFKKTGYKNPGQNPKTVKKAQKTYERKTGYKSPIQNPDVQDKIKKTNKEKYGYEHVFQVPKIKEKIDSTMNELYGASTPMQSSILHKKITKTRQENGNRSQDEIYVANYLEAKGWKEGIDYFMEYYSEEYPFHCDFYIKPLDLYVELNCHWTHGGHWFNKKAKRDIKKLQLWEQKAKTSKFYKIAIDTWTKRDVNKRRIAKKNKLNYIVLWNAKEVENWLLADMLII